MTNRRFAFAAAVRVVVRVHDRTADGRADAHVTGTTGLADVHVLMVDIADLTDDCNAVRADEADFAGRQTDLRELRVLCHQLSVVAGGADELSAAAGVDLDVVDDGTDGDIGQRQAVAGLDIGGGEGKSPVGHPGPMTPWGKPAMGLKTRKAKNRTNKYIFKHRNAK